MNSAQIELKIHFPGFQTMGMNVALSEFGKGSFQETTVRCFPSDLFLRILPLCYG